MNTEIGCFIKPEVEREANNFARSMELQHALEV